VATSQGCPVSLRSYSAKTSSYERAALGFAGCSVSSHDYALHALRTWLDSWAGIGHVAVGMHRQGFDLQLTQYDEKGWRATFYTTGMEHSPTSSRDEPTGRSRSSPWARRRLGYGSETVTLSPDAEMLKVPDAVLAAYV
jgi:hypothetical protein